MYTMVWVSRLNHLQRSSLKSSDKMMAAGKAISRLANEIASVLRSKRQKSGPVNSEIKFWNPTFGLCSIAPIAELPL